MLDILIGYCFLAYLIHGLVSFKTWKEDGEISGADSIWLVFAPLSILIYLFVFFGAVLTRP